MGLPFAKTTLPPVLALRRSVGGQDWTQCGQKICGAVKSLTQKIITVLGQILLGGEPNHALDRKMAEFSLIILAVLLSALPRNRRRLVGTPRMDQRWR